MSGRVLIVKNVEREGPGLLREVLQNNDVEADCVEMGRSDEIPSLEPYSALIVMGGPPSANDVDAAMRAELSRTQEALRMGLPYLGVCLGHQILAKAAGSTIVANPVKEVGFVDSFDEPYTVTLTDGGRYDPLFDDVPDMFGVFQLHGEAVVPSAEVEVLATGKHCAVQAIRVGRRAYGLQMHIELVPEMLAVWCEQDADLKTRDADELQRQFAAIADNYRTVGRQILTNFLALAGLASSIELHLGEPEADLR